MNIQKGGVIILHGKTSEEAFNYFIEYSKVEIFDKSGNGGFIFKLTFPESEMWSSGIMSPYITGRGITLETPVQKLLLKICLIQPEIELKKNPNSYLMGKQIIKENNFNNEILTQIDIFNKSNIFLEPICPSIVFSVIKSIPEEINFFLDLLSSKSDNETIKKRILEIKNGILINNLRIGIIAMEFLDGFKTLDNSITRNEDQDDIDKITRTQNIYFMAMFEITRLYKLGYIHNDLHEQNILFNSSYPYFVTDPSSMFIGRAMIIDFGNTFPHSKTLTDIDNERLYTTTIIPSITTDKPIGERGVSLLWKNYDWLRNKKIIQSERYANTKLFKLFTMRQQEEVRIRLPSLTEYGNIYDDDHLIINKIINLFDKWVNLISHENTDEIIDEKILLFIDKMKNDFPESNFNYREVYSKEASIRKAKKFFMEYYGIYNFLLRPDIHISSIFSEEKNPKKQAPHSIKDAKIESLNEILKKYHIVNDKINYNKFYLILETILNARHYLHDKSYNDSDPSIINLMDKSIELFDCLTKQLMNPNESHNEQKERFVKAFIHVYSNSLYNQNRPKFLLLYTENSGDLNYIKNLIYFFFSDYYDKMTTYIDKKEGLFQFLKEQNIFLSETPSINEYENICKILTYTMDPSLTITYLDEPYLYEPSIETSSKKSSCLISGGKLKSKSKKNYKNKSKKLKTNYKYKYKKSNKIIKNYKKSNKKN